MTPRNWVRQFRAAASTFDSSALHELASEYAADLYAVQDLRPDVGQVLQVLRQSLRYEDLELVADAALAHRPDAPVVRRLYAQALVDGANPAVALQLYSDLAADETVPQGDRVEARGGIGRCYKEMFLVCTEPGRRRHYLTRSLDAYLSAYHEDENNTWHGINAVALLARAGREGIELAPDASKATVLAERILQIVDADPVPGPWTEVTACEAAIALGRYDEAVERARAFLETKRTASRSRRSSASCRRSGSSPPPAPRATSCSPCCAPRC